MQNILLVAPYNLTKKEVGGAFTYQFISRLVEAGIKVDYILYSYDGDIEDPPVSKNFRVIKRIKLSTFDKLLSWIQCPIFHPLFTSRFSWNIVSFINNELRKKYYDYVVFDYSQTFTLARFVKHPHKLLIAHDVISQRYEREHSILLPWIKWTECCLVKKVEKLYSFSIKDCQLIRNRYGVECDHTPVFIKKDILNKKPEKVGNYHVFFADWGRKDNSESLEWFLVNVIDKLPDENFKVIGGNIPKSLLAMIENKQNIDYLGFVDDPYQIIADAKSEVSPLHKGAGIKVKCLEALACGTPVVGTEIAFEGISDDFSSYLFRADNPKEYVSVIKSLSMSVTEKNAIKSKFLDSYSQRSIVNYIIQNN